MRIYGLTGGIASGKSTVSRQLRSLGAEVIDADLVAREVVAPGTPGLREIAERFPGVVDSDGKLNRARLGARVFADLEARRALETITHPRIRAEFAARTAKLAASGVPRVIHEIPLLFENGLDRGMDGVILVAAPVPLQVERLRRRDGLSEAEAEARIAAQLPLEEKRRRATWVVDNTGSEEATLTRVRAIWDEILARDPRA